MLTRRFRSLRPALALALIVVSASARLTAQTPEELSQGQRLFETHCAFCHGPRGEGGKGPTLAQPTLPRASDMESLVRIIRSGLSGTEMPGSRMDPDQVRLVAKFVKSLGSQPVEAVTGDPARGAQLFAGKGACLTCHTLRGAGMPIGPDLSEVGRKRSSAHLRRSLLEPTAEVPQSYSSFRSDISMPENFLFVRVAARDGRSVAGVRVNEDTFSIQVRDLTGKVHSFVKANLAELNKDWGFSPMPAYGAVFSPPELDDLVAYLVSLRTQTAPTEGEKTNKTNTVTH